MSLRLLLVRHGETEANLARQIQGRADVPLTEAGRGQASALAEALVGEPLAAIYSSPLSRAQDTAGIIARRFGLEPRVEPRLIEMGYGRWEGMTWDEVRQRDPEGWSAWSRDQNNPATGGEGLGDVAARVGALLQNLRHEHRGDTVLLVGHGGSLRALICMAFGIPVRLYGNLAMGNTAVCELHLHRDGAVIERLNDRCHLPDDQR